VQCCAELHGAVPCCNAWRGAVLHFTSPRRTVQRIAVPCGAVCDTPCGAMWRGTVLCCRMMCSAVLHAAVQCSAVQCSAVQCSAVQCSTVQWLLCRVGLCYTVRCSSVLPAWCGAVLPYISPRRTVQRSAVWCSTVPCCRMLCRAVLHRRAEPRKQRSAARSDAVLHFPSPFRGVLHGAVRCGAMRCGAVQCSVVPC
jgi:hypothetical protein